MSAENLTEVLWTAAEVRACLKRSKAAFDRDLAAGRVPEPMRIGRSLRWARREVLEWISAGMPSGEEWAARKNAKGK